MSNNGKKSVLVQAGDKREGTGLLCTDAAGLCLSAEGVAATPQSDAAAGAYSSLLRLASQLQGGAARSPLVTIETDEASTLIKSYDGGHTVALTVPNAAAPSGTARQDSSGTLSQSEAAGSLGEGEEATS